MKNLLLAMVLCLLGINFCCVSKEVYVNTEERKPTIEMNRRMLYNSVARVIIAYKDIDQKSKKEEDQYINGSAFAINKDFLMTAGHVCEDVQGKKGLKIVIIYLAPSEKLFGTDGVEIFSIDKEKDLCLLKAKGHPLMPVRFSKRTLFYVREKVFTIGGPRGIFPIETEGFVSLNIVENKDSELNNKMITSIPIFGGNSGGPVFDENGDCIGVLVAGDTKYEHVGYITRIEDVLSFIRSSFKKK